MVPRNKHQMDGNMFVTATLTNQLFDIFFNLKNASATNARTNNTPPTWKTFDEFSRNRRCFEVELRRQRQPLTFRSVPGFKRATSQGLRVRGCSDQNSGTTIFSRCKHHARTGRTFSWSSRRYNEIGANASFFSEIDGRGSGDNRFP